MILITPGRCRGTISAPGAQMFYCKEFRSFASHSRKFCVGRHEHWSCAFYRFLACVRLLLPARAFYIKSVQVLHTQCEHWSCAFYRFMPSSFRYGRKLLLILVYRYLHFAFSRIVCHLGPLSREACTRNKVGVTPRIVTAYLHVYLHNGLSLSLSSSYSSSTVN